MIRITVEIIPYGIESAKLTLTTAEIWNDASGTKSAGNYGYKLNDVGRNKPRCWRKGEVKNFPRTRKNVWYLIRRVLNAAITND